MGSEDLALLLRLIEAAAKRPRRHVSRSEVAVELARVCDRYLPMPTVENYLAALRERAATGQPLIRESFRG
jgi:hypothetical protein